MTRYRVSPGARRFLYSFAHSRVRRDALVSSSPKVHYCMGAEDCLRQQEDLSSGPDILAAAVMTLKPQLSPLLSSDPFALDARQAPAMATHPFHDGLPQHGTPVPHDHPPPPRPHDAAVTAHPLDTVPGDGGVHLGRHRLVVARALAGLGIEIFDGFKVEQ